MGVIRYKMNYKVGDKAKIEVNITPTYDPDIKKILIEKKYILTIKEINGDAYKMEEVRADWTDYFIECLIEPIYIPITSRFDLLDL